MFCTQCGTHLSDDARFCVACGRQTFVETFSATPFSSPPAAQMYVVEAPTRRLFRIRSRRKLAGVCAGFADYFGLDVTLVRLIWVALSIMPPAIGIISYVIAWIILPVD
jgi:phage shock protein C